MPPPPFLNPRNLNESSSSRKPGKPSTASRAGLAGGVIGGGILLLILFVLWDQYEARKKKRERELLGLEEYGEGGDGGEPMSPQGFICIAGGLAISAVCGIVASLYRKRRSKKMLLIKEGEDVELGTPAHDAQVICTGDNATKCGQEVDCKGDPGCGVATAAGKANDRIGLSGLPVKPVPAYSAKA
ncbi:hypothetical protein BJ508DRAFT_329493 [Ascobolus immersus RN42]|uniref:Uncharacterized protein n=1 Tax=Ascobolus immersus RN42 TaxID=1160509 RepID=A0A3N4I8V6_ASCIM|nr:hypothetical protein BJ508DRAFT_329493 [Ascobolus immersus RN42]